MSESMTPEGILHHYVADRDPKIVISPEFNTIATYDWFSKHNTYAALAFSLLVGSIAHNKFTIAAPKLQITKPTEGDRGNKLVTDLDCLCCVNAGDDEVTIQAA